MAIVDKIEDTLNGGYSGLYGEVVTHDCYRLKKLPFVPSIVYDLGSNVGCFSLFAKSLFPNAKIIAVEPDNENYSHYLNFVATKYKDVRIIHRAIGPPGQVYRHYKAVNGAHEFYASVGLGYDEKSLAQNSEVKKVAVETVLPDVLINYHGNKNAMIKIDVEGGENYIFTHEPSMMAIKTLDYITMEIHNHASDGSTLQAVKEKTFEAMRYFEDTHDCEYAHPMFYAIKKNIGAGDFKKPAMNIAYRKDLGQLLDHFKLPRVVAEIGVAEGRFSEQICSWGIDKLYLVDNWNTITGQSGDGGHPQSWHDTNWKESHERTSACADKTVFLRGFSTEMAAQIPDNSLGMVYIDCNHAQEAVMQDLHVYYPKVVSGGIIAGHDYLNFNYGVNRAVKEFCGSIFEIHEVPDDEPNMASFWFQKK